ncbi:hypothetical protein [Streptomyces sp. NPDC048603]|uniref:hypothetical protein n=1 Tax=Streptomyces sp. NPDC048603 TaxID=3365577 RepID=UPI00371110B7
MTTPPPQPPVPPEPYIPQQQPAYQVGAVGVPQPPVAGPQKQGSPLALVGGVIAVASLVATAVFTGLLYADQVDTVEEAEKQHRISTCAYAKQDPDSWGDNTKGLNCHDLYGMTQVEWDKSYGVDYEDEDD